MNSKQGSKQLWPLTGYFTQGHGKVSEQLGPCYTYQSHMILQTPGVFRSAACRQPVSSSIHSGRCRRWSHTRAHSHCYTDGNGQREAALVTQAGWLSIHLATPLPPSSIETLGKQTEGHADPQREGGFLKA